MSCCSPTYSTKSIEYKLDWFDTVTQKFVKGIGTGRCSLQGVSLVENRQVHEDGPSPYIGKKIKNLGGILALVKVEPWDSDESEDAIKEIGLFNKYNLSGHRFDD